MVEGQKVEYLDAAEEKGESGELVPHVDHEGPVLGLHEEGRHVDPNRDDVDACVQRSWTI